MAGRVAATGEVASRDGTGLNARLVVGVLAIAASLAATGGLLASALIGVLIANPPLARFVVAATIVIGTSIPIAVLDAYLDLKIIARMNLRIGPDRVAPFGALQSLFHGLKLLGKEDITPTAADAVVFTWAPVVVYVAAVMSLVVIPFAPGLFGVDMDIGVLYVFAVGGLTVVGLLMAGWSSFNKYSLLGGLRSAAQIVSYEIPLTLSVVGLIVLAGTMSLNAIVEQQAGGLWNWYVFRQPIGFVIFFIAATAEANRTPFDLAEGDSEIVAGFATEYSGIRFLFFYFAEYFNLFVISAFTVALFFGGWNAPFGMPLPVDLGWVGSLLWFLAKTYVTVFVLVWIRATLPRIRVDQLMAFAWKWLLPAALLNLFITAFAVLVVTS
jgi:NADH-quinone oxidoreductase subunit H